METINIALGGLAPSEYRHMVKGWDKGRYAQAFLVDGKPKFRIYIPLQRHLAPPAPVPNEVSNALEKLGYTVEDYIAGIAVNADGKRRMRIGKLLQAKDEEAYAVFMHDKARASQGNLRICISRHPYDIASMSTDRGWHSCMELRDGVNKRYVEKEVKVGTIIAYLVDNKDSNIKNPTARVLMKPFYAIDLRTGKPKEGAQPVLVCDESYGTDAMGFVETVQKWVDTHINHHSTTGSFIINPQSYEDGRGNYIFVNEEKSVEENVNDLQQSLKLKPYSIPGGSRVLQIKHSDLKSARRSALRHFPQVIEKLNALYLMDLEIPVRGIGDYHQFIASAVAKLINPKTKFYKYDGTLCQLNTGTGEVDLNGTGMLDLKSIVQRYVTHMPEVARALLDAFPSLTESIIRRLVLDGKDGAGEVLENIPDEKFSDEVIESIMESKHGKMSSLKGYFYRRFKSRILAGRSELELIEETPHVLVFDDTPLTEERLEAAIKGGGFYRIVNSLPEELFTENNALFMIEKAWTVKGPTFANRDLTTKRICERMEELKEERKEQPRGLQKIYGDVFGERFKNSSFDKTVLSFYRDYLDADDNAHTINIAESEAGRIIGRMDPHAAVDILIKNFAKSDGLYYAADIISDVPECKPVREDWLAMTHAYPRVWLQIGASKLCRLLDADRELVLECFSYCMQHIDSRSHIEGQLQSILFWRRIFVNKEDCVVPLFAAAAHVRVISGEILDEVMSYGISIIGGDPLEPERALKIVRLALKYSDPDMWDASDRDRKLVTRLIDMASQECTDRELLNAIDQRDR